MGIATSHCEEKPEEPAGGQQDIQSSDTATKKKATTDMPKDAGKSKSKDSDSDSKSAPKDEVKEDSQPASKDDNKDSTDSNPESKIESKSGTADSSNDSEGDSKADSEENSKKDEGTQSNEEDNGEEEEEEEEPKITKEDVKSAPYDHRFPSFNQARHCFTRYNEFYKCTAEKGDDSDDCKFHQKAYRSICPSEWLDKWNEQRESGTWPGRY